MLNIGYFITKTTGKWNWCGEAFWKLRGIGMLANVLMFKYFVYKIPYLILLKIMKTWVNFVVINYLSLTWKVKWRSLFTPIRVTSDKCKLVLLLTAITRFYNQQLFNFLFLLGTKKKNTPSKCISDGIQKQLLNHSQSNLAKSNFDQIPKFHFVKFWKTNSTMCKYRRRGFIWMVTS